MANQYLVKDITTTVIPGNPGVPSTPGRPEIPGHWETREIYSTSIVYTSYVSYTNAMQPSPGESAYYGGYDSTKTWLVPTTVHEKTTYDIWIPTQPAVPATPGIPPVPAQLNISYNTGWNSHSMSILPVVQGDYLEYNVAVGVSGVFVGLAPMYKLGERLEQISHGIILDQTGIRVIENGVIVATLGATYTGSSKLRIYRHSDRAIVYVFINGIDTVVHKSSIQGVSKVIDLYAHALLHRGNDKVLNSSLETGEVQFGKA